MKTRRPAWPIHACGIANAYFFFTNLSTGWYFFAAMSLIGFVLSVNTLRIRQKTK
jgi:hypothetical protein